MAPPALAPLMYVGSVVNGPTAAATYYGKVDLGLGQEPTGFERPGAAVHP